MLSAPAIDADLVTRLERLGPGTLRARAADRLAFAHDASHYRMIPAGVVTVTGTDHLAALLRLSREQGLPVTFRSGGTSLSGQASTQALLVDTRRHFRGIEVLDDGAAGPRPAGRDRAAGQRAAGPVRAPARTRPGQRGGLHDRRGDRQQLQRHVLRHRVQHLPHPRVGRARAAERHRRRHRRARRRRGSCASASRGCGRAWPRCATGCAATRRRSRTIGAPVRDQEHHGLRAQRLPRPRPPGRHPAAPDGRQRGHARLRRRGGAAHGAGAAARRHRPARTSRRCGTPTGALPDLLAAGPATVELLDAASLRVAQRDPDADRGAARARRSTRPCRPAGGVPGGDARELAARRAAWQELTARLPLSRPAVLSDDPAGRAALWHIRKGLYAAVAGSPPAGTTALLEDIAVPVDRLLADLRGTDRACSPARLREQRDLRPRQGRQHPLHARPSASTTRARASATPRSPRTWSTWCSAHGGTLKAEHGTGRIMAPFVRRQYGDELYEVMRRGQAAASTPAGC